MGAAWKAVLVFLASVAYLQTAGAEIRCREWQAGPKLADCKKAMRRIGRDIDIPWIDTCNTCKLIVKWAAATARREEIVKFTGAARDQIVGELKQTLKQCVEERNPSTSGGGDLVVTEDVGGALSQLYMVTIDVRGVRGAAGAAAIASHI